MKSIATRDYATALLEVLEGQKSASSHSSSSEKKLSEGKMIENFVTVMRKNGDWAKRAQIVKEFEKLWCAKHHRDNLLVESARPLQAKQQEELRKQLHGSQGSSHSSNLDLEERINPELIAGVRLTLNDEMQLDTSLAHMLKKIFPKQ